MPHCPQCKLPINHYNATSETWLGYEVYTAFPCGHRFFRGFEDMIPVPVTIQPRIVVTDIVTVVVLTRQYPESLDKS